MSLLYSCVMCGRTWGDPQALDISHGYCRDCIREHFSERIWKHQLRKTGIACFATCETCGNLECIYRSACLPSEVQEWRKSIVSEAQLFARTGTI